MIANRGGVLPKPGSGVRVWGLLCYNSLMVKKEKLASEPDKTQPKPPKNNPINPHTMPGALRILLSLLFMTVMAVVFTWFMEYRHRMCDEAATWQWLTAWPLVFAYNCVLMFLILAFIVALFWRTFFGTGVTFALLSILTYISMEKYKVRQAPLMPEDFQMVGNAGEVAGFVEVWGIVRLVLGVIFVLIGSGMLEHYVRKFLGREPKALPWWQRHSLIPRTACALLAAVGLLMTTDFAVHHKQDGDQYVPWLNTSFISWGPTENYKQNGFLLGFFYNLGRLELDEPEDYSAERIAEIKATYTQLQNADTGRKELSDVVDNIIVILDETFYDPELLSKLYPHVGGDPLPNLRKVFQENPSGYMYSPEYGGGTANIEFEVFTGLSNYWANSTQYINTIPKLPSLQSVASWALESGFNTTAVHAYDGSVYKRDIVYPKIGFEKFIDMYKMTHQEYENGVGQMSDSAVYKEILDILRENTGKQMIGAVTMQNHTPYDGANYPQLDYKITSEYGTSEIESSFQSLHYADEYLGDFLKELDKLDEKTVVLWFGDHAAGIINAYITSIRKYERDLAHLTPYFVYANFDIESEFTTAEVKKLNEKYQLNITSQNVDLPTTTPNCLGNTLYNLLEVKKPTLMYVLDEVCDKTPILARKYFEENVPAAYTALQDYELINYDLLSGNRYWAND